MGSQQRGVQSQGGKKTQKTKAWWAGRDGQSQTQ
jgi:hypothetical protein